jgi:putative sugar O-methyltransferase
MGLLAKLTEDDNFGNFSFAIGGRNVSRDLLDSMTEIYFLDRHLQIASRPDFRVLDIGAGYGRLAHRMTSALPGLASYACTDAFAISTFVSEFYLRFRGVEKGHVVPLDEIDETLGNHQVDLAINIHSFSECRPQAVEWWARLLSKHRVKNLMIVPNGEGETSTLLTNDGQDFLPILERYGYRRVVKEPKYLDPLVQEYGLTPSWHHLLELRP